MVLDDPSIFRKDSETRNPARAEHKVFDMASPEADDSRLSNSRTAVYPGDIPAGIFGLCHIFRRIGYAAREFAEGISSVYCAMMMPMLDEDDDSDYEK